MIAIVLLLLVQYARGHIVAGGLLTHLPVDIETAPCSLSLQTWHLAKSNMMKTDVVKHPDMSTCSETDILWGPLTTMSIPALLPMRVLHVTEHGVDWAEHVSKNQYLNICRTFGHSKESCTTSFTDTNAKLNTWCDVNRKIRDDSIGVLEHREFGDSVKYKRIKLEDFSQKEVSEFLFGSKLKFINVDAQSHITTQMWHRIDHDMRACLTEFGYDRS